MRRPHCREGSYDQFAPAEQVPLHTSGIRGDAEYSTVGERVNRSAQTGCRLDLSVSAPHQSDALEVCPNGERPGTVELQLLLPDVCTPDLVVSKVSGTGTEAASGPAGIPGDGSPVKLVDLRELLTDEVHAVMLESPNKPDLFSNLCFPLSLIYNVHKLASTATLSLNEIRLRGAELQSRIGCRGEMIPPAKQKELLSRTGTSCALIDEGAGLLIVMGSESVDI